MKKILTLTAILLTSGAALAQDHDMPPPQHGGPHGGHRGGMMFKKIDTNGDGVITKDEHQAFSDKMFSKMDTNGDGSVTKEEGKEAREKMREKFKNFRKEHGGEGRPTPPEGTE